MKIEHDSEVNQRIKGQLVARDVLACFSYEMDAVLKHSECGRADGLPQWDEIENLYAFPCPECGEPFQDATDFEDGDGLRCPACKATFEDEPEQEPQEIFEWWIVSKWLYNRLNEQGEPVLEFGNNCYWGRTSTGQAIKLDGVISRIAEGMEILEGQANSWADRG